MKRPKPSFPRTFALVLAAGMMVALVTNAPAGAGPRQPQQPIRVEVDLVNILASVADRNNRPVTTLSKDAFAVFDDGAPQQIAIFEPETHLPLDLALMIDTSASTRIDFPVEKEAASKFIRGVVRPGDGLGVFSFADDVRQLTGFSSDVPVLQNAVRNMKQGAGTALYDAVYLGAQRLGERKSDRKSVV